MKRTGSKFKVQSSTLLLCVALWLCASVANAAGPYYIDYVGGSDANAGTSTGAPWKHVPAMQPFSGSYAHTAGDRFIFKGGVTWPNAALPLKIALGGSGLTVRDYYGVDTNWYTGGAWSRPIFDGEDTPFVNWSGQNGNMIYVTAEYVMIDNIEGKRWVWNDPVNTSVLDGFFVFISNTPGSYIPCSVAVANLYGHDWSVQVNVDGKFGGIGAYPAASIPCATNCLFVAPAVVAAEYRTTGTHNSGLGFYFCDIVDSCEIVGTSSGIWQGTLITNSIVRDGGDSFHADNHENPIWNQAGTVINNKFLNLAYGGALFFLPSWGGVSGGRVNVIGNLFYNTTQVDFDGAGAVDETGELWVINNTFASVNVIGIGSAAQSSPFAKFVYQNNLHVTDLSSNAQFALREEDLTNIYTNANNRVITIASALAVGMIAPEFKPTLNYPVIHDAGAPTALHTQDRLGVSVPQGSGVDIGWNETNITASVTPPRIAGANRSVVGKRAP